MLSKFVSNRRQRAFTPADHRFRQETSYEQSRISPLQRSVEISEMGKNYMWWKCSLDKISHQMCGRHHYGVHAQIDSHLEVILRCYPSHTPENITVEFLLIGVVLFLQFSLKFKYFSSS